MKSPAAIPTRTIAVIAFEGVVPFHLSVPCLVFADHHVLEEVPRFEVKVCAVDRRVVRTSAGFEIATPYGLDDIAGADVVIVPSWHDDFRPAPREMIEALRAAHGRGARIVGLCLGAFPLAESGLLDGRCATTHWELAPALAARYPKVKVDARVLYVDETDVLTSAGVAAALDCCLHLLRQMTGADNSARIARHLVLGPHRHGKQAQYIDKPVPLTRSDDRFAEVLAWMAEHLEQSHSIDMLAARSLMSRSTFTRQFRMRLGISVKQWLLQQRLALVQRLLETSDAPVDAIALSSGFGSPLSLRKHFRAAFDTTPSAYRKRFQPTHQMGTKSSVS
jgi:transcriptional regulator GlxA family with amidase domain